MGNAEAADASEGILDTSVFIARENGRPLGLLPQLASISVVTLAELHLGVLMANDSAVRAQRLHTLSTVESTFEPLPIDASVARMFADLVAEARRQGRRPGIMDTWIAATAAARDLPLYTQDADFGLFPRLRIIRV